MLSSLSYRLSFPLPLNPSPYPLPLLLLYLLLLLLPAFSLFRDVKPNESRKITKLHVLYRDYVNINIRISCSGPKAASVQ